MNKDEIRRYWEKRAEQDSSPQSTTNDIYMREIEFLCLRSYLYSLDTKKEWKVADVGCGDGRETARLAQIFPKMKFTGYDFCDKMLENAKRVNVPFFNLRFEKADICEELPETYDIIYTTRCLINIPTWELQKTAINNIYDALNKGGRYHMVENFVDGQFRMNGARKLMGLLEIPIREHNLFFQEDVLTGFILPKFEILYHVNISSSYYFATRVLYAAICKEQGKEPDYTDDHHRLATMLPFVGELGPIKLYLLGKRT